VLLACCVEHGTHIKVRDLQMMSWPWMVEIRLVRCVVEAADFSGTAGVELRPAKSGHRFTRK
jgi:hypothetical protein